MNALTEVQRLLTLGAEIETNMPKLRQISFTVENLAPEQITQVSQKHDCFVIPPNVQNKSYRTTALSGKVKVLCISKPIS